MDTDMIVFKRPAHDSHRHFAEQIAVAVLTCAMFAACGGGGGGGGSGGNPVPSITGNGFAPDTGPGDADNYFPKTVGNEWSLAYTVNHAGFFTTTNVVSTSVLPSQTILGVDATVISQVDPVSGTDGVGTYDSYYATSPGGVTLLGTSDATDTLTAGIVPYPQLLFPVGLGQIGTITVQSLPVGTDGTGNPLLLDMVQHIENAGFVAVDVPAGSFPHALEQVTTISGAIRDEALGLSSSFIGSDSHWLAPGVGLVKQSSTFTVDGSPNTSAMELRGYRVDGVSHGLGAPMSVLGGLSPGDGLVPTQTGTPVAASDGQHFLVVARKVVSTPDHRANWVAKLVDEDGAPLTAAVDLGAPTPPSGASIGENAAVVFDGVEYIVVYEQAVDSGFGPESSSLVAVRLTTQGALIGSPTTVAASSASAPAAVMPVLDFDGTRCLLGLVRHLSTGFSRVTGVFLSPSTGAADGAEFDISAAPGFPSAPALAFDGFDHVIVWDQTQWATQLAGIYAARVSTTGEVLDMAGIPVHAEPSCCVMSHPAIASDGNGSMVLWEAYLPAADGTHIFANRIAPNGQLLDGDSLTGGIALTSAPDRDELSPTLVYFDGNYLAAWLVSTSPVVYEGLFGVRITPQGSVLGSAAPGVQLTTHELQPHPKLAAARDSCLLTWFHGEALEPSSVGGLSIHPFAH